LADADKGRAFLDKEKASKPTTVTTHDIAGELLDIHRKGYSRGDRTGWLGLDKLYSVAPGQITTITGWPNSGKSEFLDAMSMALCRQGWRFCMCSLENIPIALHAEKMITRHVGKPLREGPSPRMSEEEVVEAADDIDDWYSFVLPGEQKPNPSLEDVMLCFEEDFRRRDLWGVATAKRAVVIDPWNELEHFRPRGMMLSEYVGESLSMLRQWSRKNLVHVFIVGHPAKQTRLRDTGKLPVPTPDMISDSAHFWNKSDNCITVQLTDEHNSPFVDIHVQKIRFKHIGHRGMATLKYDRVTGRYADIPQEID
jgi:twinkle protein